MVQVLAGKHDFIKIYDFQVFPILPVLWLDFQ